jgi:hypothetical protein
MGGALTHRRPLQRPSHRVLLLFFYETSSPCSHRSDNGTSASAECHEQRRAIEHGERLGAAEEHEPESNDYRSEKDELSRTKPMEEEPYGGTVSLDK